MERTIRFVADEPKMHYFLNFKGYKFLIFEGVLLGMLSFLSQEYEGHVPFTIKKEVLCLF